MHSIRMRIAAVCLLAATALAPAAAPAVLSGVPAGSMGYLVLPNVEKSMQDLDSFLTSIGVGMFLKQGQPDAALLDIFLQRMQINEGFDRTGSMVVVMLDPADYGIDLIEAIKTDQAPEKLPFVVCIPSTDMEALLAGKLDPNAVEGEYHVIAAPDGPMYARQVGSHAMLSPMTEAIEAMASVSAPAAGELTASQADLLGATDVGAYMNFQKLTPVLLALMEKAEAEAADAPAEGPMNPAEMIKLYREIYGPILRQADDTAVSLRFSREHLLIEEIFDFLPDSAMARAFLNAEPGEGELLDRLPDQPYMLALGGRDMGEQANKALIDMLLPLYRELFFQGQNDEYGRFEEIVNTYVTQGGTQQMVIGGPPAGEDTGLVAMTAVYKVKDAAAVMEATDEYFQLIPEMIRHMLASAEDGNVPEGLDSLAFEKTVGIAEIDGVSIDAYTVQTEELANLDADEKAQLRQWLGSEDVQILMARPSEHTLVMTLGGGTDQMAASLKLADGGGAIPAEPGLQKAMGYMPEDPFMVGAISVGNIVEVVTEGRAKLGLPPMPLAMSVKDPWVMAVGLQGREMHGAGYVPASSVREIVQTAMMFMMGGMQPGGPGGRPQPQPDGGGQ